MSATRLPDRSTQRASVFSVVAVYLADTNSNFVRHVALLREDTDLTFAKANVAVWHMGPPLAAGVKSISSAGEEPSCTVHAMASIELEADEVEGIQTWLYEVDQENRPSNALRQYIVHPPMDWVRSENGTRLYRRFSCAGFVLECYRAIGIELIDESGFDNLPEVDLQVLANAYGNEIRRENLRRRLGLSENGPWKIVLAGYVLHSLNRSDEAVRRSPYKPKDIAESNFP